MRVGDVVVGVLALGHRLATLLDGGHLRLEVRAGVSVGAPHHLEGERDGRGADEHADGDHQAWGHGRPPGAATGRRHAGRGAGGGAGGGGGSCEAGGGVGVGRRVSAGGRRSGLVPPDDGQHGGSHGPEDVRAQSQLSPLAVQVQRREEDDAQGERRPSPYNMASPDVGPTEARRARTRRIRLGEAPLREGVVDISMATAWHRPV